MVSDVLFSAIQEIDAYLEEERYSDAEAAMIGAVRVHMRFVQAYLDRPPFDPEMVGTPLERFHQNETGK
jgi:hypothetical protein